MLLTGPAPSLSQLQLSSAEKPTGTALPIRGSALNGASTDAAELNRRIPEPAVAMCERVVEEAEQITSNSNMERGKKEDHGKEERVLQSQPERGDEARMEPLKDDRLPQLPTKNSDKLGEDVDREIHRTTKPQERKALTSDKPDALAGQVAAIRDEPDSERAKQEEIQATVNQRHPSEADKERRSAREPLSAVEVHPEEKAKPSVGFAEPAATSRPVSETITPAVSPDEEEEEKGSPAQSGRPRTLSFISEKYAGLLGHSYRPGSTSSSSDIESPLCVAKKKLLNQSECAIANSLEHHSLYNNVYTADKFGG